MTNVISLHSRKRIDNDATSTDVQRIGASQHGLVFAEANRKSPLLFPVDVRALSYNESKGSSLTATKCETHKLLIREDTKQPLAVVGMDYATLDNRTLFERVEMGMLDALDARHFDGMQIRDRIAYNGRDSMREYCFVNEAAQIDAKSRTQFRVVVFNSYGASAFKVFSGFIDAYCENGMIVGDYSRIIRRHTKGLTVDGVVEYIDAQVRTYSKWNELFKHWATVECSPTLVRSVLDSLAKRGVMPRRTADMIATDYVMRERINHGDTLWAFVSAMTYYSTHHTVRLTKNDHAATTVLERQVTVNDWLNSAEFKRLAA